MRYLFLISLFLAACLVASTPIDRSHELVNHPPPGLQTRLRRSEVHVKGRRTEKSDLEKKVRKGEYVCGDKICKLRPGEIPPACDVCQYPI